VLARSKDGRRGDVLPLIGTVVTGGNLDCERGGRGGERSKEEGEFL
jgi:hypothetical protein